MKRFFTYFMSLLCLMVGGTTAALAQTATIGLTQNVFSDVTNDKVVTGAEHVSVNVALGSKITWNTNQGTAGQNKKRNVFLDGTQYSNIDKLWRKEEKGVYDNQNITLNCNVESGYKVNLEKVSCRILVGDDTYTWYVQILNSNGESVWTSSERTTTKASTATLEAADDKVQAIELTGAFTVNLWVKQGGTTKYFVVDPFTVDLVVSEDARTTHNITTSVSTEGAGTVNPAGTSAVIEGSDAVLTATANLGYKFKNWTLDGVTVTENPYTIENVTADHEAVANFDELPVLTFAKPEGVTCVTRHFPTNINTCDIGEKVTLPVNYMYYKEGYTMTAWTDGEVEVAPGAEYTVTGNVTLSPVFTENTKSIASRVGAVTVNYNFARKNNGGRYVNVENNADIYIVNANVDGEVIDIALPINCIKGAGISDKNGKVNNTSDTERAQVNQGTVFTFENVVKGTTITVTAVVNVAASDNITFNGVEDGVVDGKTLTYSATADGDVTAIVKQGNFYVEKITVVYPVPTEDVAISAAGWASYAPAMDVTVPEGVEAYYVSAQNGSRAILTPIAAGTAVKANEGILLKGESGTVTFEKAVSAEAISGNLLSGTQVSLPVSDVTGQVYVLGLESTSGEVGLWQYTGETLAAGKAYLALPVASKGFTFAFGSDEATGVETVSAATANGIGAAYNLAGQQVGAGYKGIVVKDGKKVMVK